MTAALGLYVHSGSGSVMEATPEKAASLGEAWKPLRVVKNEKGEQVMRFELDGATIDISESDIPSVSKEIIDVDAKSE